jgi:hypothetical protein
MNAQAAALEHLGGARSDNTFTRPGSDGSGGERGGQTAGTGEAVPRPDGIGIDPSADATATASGGAATAAPAAQATPGSPGASTGVRSSGAARATQQPPPWASPSWPADRAAAGEAVRSGRVPDPYRDVVSAYFNADAENAGRN